QPGHAHRVRGPRPRTGQHLHRRRCARRHRGPGGPDPGGAAVSGPRRWWAPVVVVALALSACSGDQGGEEEDDVEVESTTTTVGETTTSAAPVEPTLDEAAIALQEIAVVENPVALAARPSSPDLYVAEKGGRVLRITVST